MAEMNVLAAAQMRHVDERTIALGIPGLILMENAAHRVVECMRERFGPLAKHRVAIYCGKGNNGGDGLAIARLLAVVDKARVDVILASAPDELSPDAAAQYNMLTVADVNLGFSDIPTLVVDALLGTGTTGPPRERVAELIAEINLLDAPVIAVDHPSGMETDSADSTGPVARATLTVTFTAPKPCHVLPPNCDRLGELRIRDIGSPQHLLESQLHLTSPADFTATLNPRARGAHKGNFGHVLVVGGAKGKTGAAEMAGLAALRSGAGWVSVHSAADRLSPELMTADQLDDLSKFTVLAVGPGMGPDPKALELFRKAKQPMVVDADALNQLAQAKKIPAAAPALRVLTPHPGEMKRLEPKLTGDRVTDARNYSIKHSVVLVLKGQRSLVAFPDGHVHVNPTGTPAMGKAGSGDILTGMIAAMLAQFPNQPKAAILAAVWLHGRAGEHAEARLTDRCVIATDLLTHLPDAIRDAQNT